ncbi:hypothetical protein Flavo103_41460 [Flavobacterium collinsii]|uniref:hypothetical protein n=1 Tax=Flavobacterium collinsii TaxID=1114861 RepID=UPI0022C1A4D9|nr:hypothetical protein [Flavobacterium collinsii]GIQ61010.1 hypothetical protein Flavo103_41460 [Flavobacterium collinsii]
MYELKKMTGSMTESIVVRLLMLEMDYPSKDNYTLEGLLGNKKAGFYAGFNYL